MTQTNAFAAQLALVTFICLTILIPSLAGCLKFVAYRITFTRAVLANLVVLQVTRSTIPFSATYIAYKLDYTNIIWSLVIADEVAITIHVMVQRVSVLGDQIINNKKEKDEVVGLFSGSSYCEIDLTLMCLLDKLMASYY
jgi:hypothetical protein